MLRPPRLLLLSGALLLLTGACGPSATAPAPATPPAPTAGAEPASPPRPPAKVSAGAFPEDVQLYAEITGVHTLLAVAGRALGAEAIDRLRAAVAEEIGIPAPAAARLIDAIASIHLGGRRAGKDIDGAVSIAFTDAQPVRDLVASGVLSEQGAFGPHGLRMKVKNGKDTLAWFEGPGLLVAGDARMLDAIALVVEGRAPEVSEAQRQGGAGAGDTRFVRAFVAPALLDELGDGKVSFPAPLSVAYELWAGGFRGAYRATINAPWLDGGLPAPPPRAFALARALPAETAGYLDLSTAIPDGPQGAARLLERVVALGGRDAQHAVTAVDAILAGANLRLADLLGTLGNEGVVSVSVRPGAKSQAELEKGYAVLWVQELADPKPAERLLAMARDKLATQPKKAKVHADPSGFSADLVDAPFPLFRARIARGRLVLGLGPRDLLDRAALALDKGKGTLGDDAAHARALKGMPPSAQALMWIDLGRAASIAAAQMAPAQRGPLEIWHNVSEGPGRATSALSLTATPDRDRIRFELDEVNGVGALAVLGLNGVRTYLASAKSAEAKNTLGAMTRAAVAAYEREQLGPGGSPTVVHSLCKSAQPVPAAVPRGVKYQPSTRSGADWEAGDPLTGWRCLHFAMSQPHYYQYTYSAGGPYKGPRRGGPDPGPNGFEVAAEGDLDGNGVTSLFTRIGTVDPRTGSVRVSTEIFIDKEKE